MSPAKIIENIEVKIENTMSTDTSVLLSPKPGTSSSFRSSTKDPVSSPRISPEKICSVETVSDLINAQILLKSDEDFQIVVANDILETNEYKTFISHLNLPPQTGLTPHPDDREISSNPVLPNTPELQPSTSR